MTTTVYDPEVSPGGPWSTRELAGLTIRKMSVSEMHNNVYLLTCLTSGAQLLIDAADDADRIRELVTAGGAGLDHLVTTHQHWDHVRALVEVTKEFAPETHAGEDDASSLPQQPDHRLRHGDVIAFGDAVLDVVHLRGHTPGSVALAYDDPAGHVHLFSGDSLFAGGHGRTTREVDHVRLMDDLEDRVFGVYDDATWFYPGHGTDSTLGAERPHLQEWRERGW